MLQGPTAKAHFGGGKNSGALWIRKEKSRPPKDPNSTLDEWRKYRCAYANTNDKCRGECRIAKSKQNGLSYIAFGNVQHNHTTGKFKKGLGIAVKTELFNSPSKVLKKRPSEYIVHLATIPEASMSRKEQSQAKSFQSRQKKKIYTGYLPTEVNPNSYGAVVSTLDQLHLDVVSAAGAGFTKHTGFLCTTHNDDYISIDNQDCEEGNRVVAVISTQNLLLNAYRATMQGGPTAIHVDASQRYHKSDWLFYLPVSVTSMNQSCHIVAYALTTSEDWTAQKFIIHAVKYRVERIVNDMINDPMCGSI